MGPLSYAAGQKVGTLTALGGAAAASISAAALATVILESTAVTAVIPFIATFASVSALFLPAVVTVFLIGLICLGVGLVVAERGKEGVHRSQLESLEAQQRSVEEENNEVRTARQEAEERVVELEEELQGVQVQLQDTTQTTNQRVQELQRQLEIERKAAAHLQEELYTQSQLQLDVTQREEGKVQLRIEQLEAELQKQIQTDRGEIQALQRRLKEADDRVAKFKEISASLNEKERELRRLKSAQALTERVTQNLRTQNRDLRKENRNLANARQAALEEIEEFKQDIRRLQQELDQILAQVPQGEEESQLHYERVLALDGMMEGFNFAGVSDEIESVQDLLNSWDVTEGSVDTRCKDLMLRMCGTWRRELSQKDGCSICYRLFGSQINPEDRTTLIEVKKVHGVCGHVFCQSCIDSAATGSCALCSSDFELHPSFDPFFPEH